MNSSETADFISRLRKWYRRHHRPLPWRRTTDPYRIWVSEVMLQQTTVEAVLPYYRRWFKHYPDLPRLAQAPMSRILKDWQGLGYYQRARNLQAAARLILERHGGRFPDTPEDLSRLPGVGPYTAAAVLSLAFDKPAAVLEANVRRVMMRLLRLKGRASARTDSVIKKTLEAFIPRRRGAGLFNQAMMELGALVCRPSSPRCLACPVTGHCSAYKRGEQEVIPQPKKRETHQVTAAVAVICRNGRVFIQQRPEKGLLGGLWEFPGGRVEPGETPEKALRREVREELGVEVQESAFLARVKHSYTKFRVDLHAFLCRLESPPRQAAGRRWVRKSELRSFAFPSGSAKVVDALFEVEARRGASGGGK